MQNMHTLLALCGLFVCSTSLAMDNTSTSDFTSSQKYLGSCQKVVDIVHRARVEREAQEARDRLAYESSKQASTFPFQYDRTSKNNNALTSVTISAITPGIAAFVAKGYITMQKTRSGILHADQADSSFAESQEPATTFEDMVARQEISTYRKLIEFYDDNFSWKALNSGPSSMFMMSEKAFEGHWQAHCAAQEQAIHYRKQLELLEKVYPNINITPSCQKDL